MATDPIIELLAKQSMTRLDEMESELEQIARRSAFELEQVREAKRLKLGSRGRNTEPEVVPPDGVRRRRVNGRGNKREPIRRIMQTDPSHEWRPGEVQRALAEQGIQLSRDGTRVTMNRMVEEHELEKLGEGGGYVLPTHRQASFDQSSANGGDPAAEERETGLETGAR